MNITRKDDEDYITFASVVNKHSDDFKLSELNDNNLKCLIFVQGLVSNKDADIRGSVLNKLENEPNLTLQQIAEDFERFVKVHQDSKDIEESGISYIENMQQKQNQSTTKSGENKVFCPLNNALATGIRTTHTDLKSV